MFGWKLSDAELIQIYGMSDKWKREADIYEITGKSRIGHVVKAKTGIFAPVPFKTRKNTKQESKQTKQNQIENKTLITFISAIRLTLIFKVNFLNIDG